MGIAATPDGDGYWLVATNGLTIFSFSDAAFYGSTGSLRLNKPIVGMASTPSGKGYWMVASDGGIFSFGDAPFYGTMGGSPLDEPIVGITSDPATGGYWEVASDSGIFADRPLPREHGAVHLNKPIVGMEASPNGQGYRFVASDGGIFTFGQAPFEGPTAARAGRPGRRHGAERRDQRLLDGRGGRRIFTFGGASYLGRLVELSRVARSRATSPGRPVTGRRAR